MKKILAWMLLGGLTFWGGMMAEREGWVPYAPSPQETGTVVSPDVPRTPWVALAKGKVDVEGGLIRLASRRDGVVRDVLVEEGTSVEPGQVLAVLDDRQARLRVESAQRELSRRQAEIPPLSVRLAAARREARRMARLAEEHCIPTQLYDQAQDEVRVREAELAALHAEVKIARSQVAVEENEVRFYRVVAPGRGRIVKRMARPGDGVSTTNVTPLFLFAPEVPRIVRAELDESFVGLVKPQMAAELVLESPESSVLPAQVLRLGQVFGMRQTNDDPSERQDVRVVEVVLSCPSRDLLIGQRVLVRFLPPEATASLPRSR